MPSSHQLPIYIWPLCYNPRSIYAIPLIPLRGFIFFSTHPELWGNFMSVMAPQLGLTAILFVLLYLLVFTIQVFWGIAILCIGPVAPIVLFLNFLHQVDAVAQRLGLVFFYQLPLDSLFDYVYSLNSSEREDSIMRAKFGREGKFDLAQTAELFFLELPRILITWPTDNLTVFLTIWMMTMPFIGPIVTVLIEAPKKGRVLHERYFTLKGLSDRQIFIYHDDMWWHYYTLGVIAGSIESIPFLSTLFVFTNRTGAAMWATDLENFYISKARGLQE